MRAATHPANVFHIPIGPDVDRREVALGPDRERVAVGIHGNLSMLCPRIVCFDDSGGSPATVYVIPICPNVLSDTIRLVPNHDDIPVGVRGERRVESTGGSTDCNSHTPLLHRIAPAHAVAAEPIAAGTGRLLHQRQGRTGPVRRGVEIQLAGAGDARAGTGCVAAHVVGAVVRAALAVEAAQGAVRSAAVASARPGAVGRVEALQRRIGATHDVCTRAVGRRRPIASAGTAQGVAGAVAAEAVDTEARDTFMVFCTCGGLRLGETRGISRAGEAPGTVIPRILPRQYGTTQTITLPGDRGCAAGARRRARALTTHPVHAIGAAALHTRGARPAVGT